MKCHRRWGMSLMYIVSTVLSWNHIFQRLVFGNIEPFCSESNSQETLPFNPSEIKKEPIETYCQNSNIFQSARPNFEQTAKWPRIKCLPQITELGIPEWFLIVCLDPPAPSEVPDVSRLPLLTCGEADSVWQVLCWFCLKEPWTQKGPWGGKNPEPCHSSSERDPDPKVTLTD